VLLAPPPRAPETHASPPSGCRAAQEPGQTSISLETKVDPGLLSGITVEIGDKYLDFSVATQLKKLQMLLKDGI
jgi:hypothetical protein